jgi:NADH-quinone oxidoreductase subunit B
MADVGAQARGYWPDMKRPEDKLPSDAGSTRPDQVDLAIHKEVTESGSFLMGKLDELVKWARSNSLWPFTFGLACCAIEMMAAYGSHFDVARFGAEVSRASPRQCDLIIVPGTVIKKMAPRIRNLYDQMADPKYVIAMGSCAIDGGPYQDAYNVVKGVDLVIPVDVYVPGCPPRPDALLEGLMVLQEKIRRHDPPIKVGPFR